MSSIWYICRSYVPSLHGCGWPFWLGLCVLNLLNCLHHWLLQPFFLLPINCIFCFPWLSILEHLFFNYFTSCCNINIHHIHIWSNSLCHSNNWTSATITDFPWNIFCISWNFGQFVILCPFKPKMWQAYENILCNFWLSWATSIATIVVYFFFLKTCLHIVISHSVICAKLINLPCISLCF